MYNKKPGSKRTGLFNLLVLVAHSLRTLVVLMLRHFFAPFLLDGTHVISLFLLVAELVNDLIERKLDDPRSSVLGERGNEIAYLLLLDHGLYGEPILVIEPVDRGGVEGGKSLDNLVERLGRSVALEKNAALGLEGAGEKHLKLLELGSLGLVLPARLVGDETRGGSQDRIDDAEVVCPEGAARLREIDDGVNEFGSLDLGSAPGELYIGLDAILLEIALDEPHGLRRDALAVQVLDRLNLGIVRDGENPADRVGGGLGVVELADLLDIASVLVDPVVAADAGIKKAELHIAAHLLRPQKTALDLLVINRRNITAAGAGYAETRALEKREGRFLQAAFWKS